jgi:hypothetical protein
MKTPENVYKGSRMKKKKPMGAGRRAKALTKRIVTNLAKYTRGGTRWQLVEFLGPKGGESSGIVDIFAIRKDHSSQPKPGLKHGDLFEIVLIQTKGGTAPWPTFDDADRMRIVARHYGAKHVVLTVWKKGKKPSLYRLKKSFKRDGDRKDAWREVKKWREVFG